MKPMRTVSLALHRTYEKTKEYSGEPVFYVFVNGAVKRIVGDATIKWLKSLRKGTILRVTSTNGFEFETIALQDDGVKVVTAHWHKTGIAKNLTPQEIVTQFAALADDVLTPVSIRKDILELKQHVKARFAAIDYRKQVYLRMMSVRRGYGFSDKDELPEQLFWLDSEASQINDLRRDTEGKIEAALLETARLVPEYTQLSAILAVEKEGFSAAGVVAYLGDPTRFHSVSAMWKYAGLDVVDGVGRHRKKGEPAGYHVKLKTVLWMFVDSAVKNSKTWKPIYQQLTEKELRVHLQKCEKCRKSKTPESAEIHSKHRARRLIAKEILKQYFVATNQQSEQPHRTAFAAD